VTSQDRNVKQIIQERLQEGSLPGRRSDQHLLALCIEGGGIRGSISAGMGIAIQQLNILPAFDRVYGTSVGALNGAYLLAGQACEEYAALYRYAVLPGHLFPGNFSGRWPIDTGWLFNKALPERAPIDWDRLWNAPQTLHPLVWQLGWREARDGSTLITPGNSKEMSHLLRAAASPPLLSELPLPHHQLDAGPFEPWPMYTPLRDGCSHLVILRTCVQEEAGTHQSVWGAWGERISKAGGEFNRRAGGGKYADHEKALQSMIGPSLRAVRPSQQWVQTLDRDAARIDRAVRESQKDFRRWWKSRS